MTQLQILTPFKELLINVTNSLDNYNDNLRNELFEKEINEDNEQAYKRGETIFDQCEENLRNLNEIIQQERNIIEFFEKCKENKTKLIDQKNDLINKMLRLMKNNVDKEEYLDLREFWNKRREETKDERNRRETEEMLEEIKEEKKELKFLIEEAKKQNVETIVKREINQFTQENKMKYNLDDNSRKLNCDMISSKQIKQLEEWTGLSCGHIIFDSNRDNWSQETSVFNDRIMGKKQLTFLIEDEDGEIFGYYLNTQLTFHQNGNWEKTDQNSFHFNLHSKNNRLEIPMKFEILSTDHGYGLYDNSHERLIGIGNIRLYKENKKNESHCYQDYNWYDYHGISSALCGKSGNEFVDVIFLGERFKPKRFIVIQMK